MLPSQELSLEAVEHEGGYEIDVVGLASDGDDAVTKVTSGESQHAAGVFFKAVLKRDTGVGIVGTDWLVAGETSQSDLAKDRAGSNRRHEGRAPARPPFPFGAGWGSGASAA